MVMADLDHFKRVNDTFGHAIGDSVLKTFSDIMQLQVRDTDVVARFGGEEFVISMPECGRDDARAVAERIRAQVEKTIFSSSIKTITASFGVAELTGSETAESLLHRADQAMYAAKAAGRNRVIGIGVGQSPPVQVSNVESGCLLVGQPSTDIAA